MTLPMPPNMNMKSVISWGFAVKMIGRTMSAVVSRFVMRASSAISFALALRRRRCHQSSGPPMAR
jgi:hypothetical protein